MVANTATRAETLQFLEALAPDGELTFSTFTDAKPKPTHDRLAGNMYGNYRHNAGRLAALNARGAGVFVMVNRGDGKGRKAANVQSIRAVFVDLDGAPLTPVLAAPIPPAVVCESSPGKHHAYWPIAGMPVGDFRKAQRSLAAQYGGDSAVCDPPRVMRLPGYVHAKGEPYTSRLLHCDPVVPLQWPDFAERMGLQFTLPLGARQAEQWEEGNRNHALYRFACGLRGQGRDQIEALRRAQVANDTRCIPPLSDDEVRGIVDSAWRGEAIGFVKLSNSLLDSEAFRALSSNGKTAILALVRQYNGGNNGRLAFTRSEAKAWGLNRYQRTHSLEACELADLIECTARGTSACPGSRATPDLFRLLFVP